MALPALVSFIPVRGTCGPKSSVLRAQGTAALSKHLGSSCLPQPLPGPDICRQAAGLGPRGEAGTGTSLKQARPAGPGQGRRDTSPEHGPRRPGSLSPGPVSPLTSRAADRHSSASRSPWLSLWPPGDLLCGRGLYGPCQLSSRTRTRAMLGRGPGACSRSGPFTSNLRRPRQGRVGPHSRHGPTRPQVPRRPRGVLTSPACRRPRCPSLGLGSHPGLGRSPSLCAFRVPGRSLALAAFA